MTQTLTAPPDVVRDAYDRDGYYVHTESVVDPALLSRGGPALDAVAAGTFETGVSPVEYKPVASPTQLVKLEQPQFASHALREIPQTNVPCSKTSLGYLNKN